MSDGFYQLDPVHSFKITPKSREERKASLVLWLDEVGMEDVDLVGGKNSSLGEMIQNLSAKGVNVPSGFATTARAYRLFIEKNNLEPQLRQLFEGLDINNTANLASVGAKARALILNSPFPDELRDQVLEYYKKLCERYGETSGEYRVDVAVRSSATAEDLPDASFAGQQETYLNVHGLDGIIDACRKCFASIFTNRAISYRTLKNFDHFNVALSIGVQKMVRSDLASAGVAFSIDTESGFKDAVLVTAAYGLGENVVQGAVNPDEWLVHKPTLKQGFRPIINRQLGSKNMKMLYETGGSKLTKNVPVSPGEASKFCLNDDEVLTLARWVIIIEDHYSERRGKWTPMDVEWAKDGHSNRLFIVQARPETVHSQRERNVMVTYNLKKTGKENVIATGRAVGSMVGSGKACVIKHVSEIDAFEPGCVLVTHRTDPDWEPIMKKSSAIVTDQGGRTCHAAIIARELGIPAIVGANDGCDTIPDGQEITVSCAEGEEGKVYEGLIEYEMSKTEVDKLPPTKTQVMMNVGNPSEALSLSSIPCEGVGLARMEFIIANHIKTHPLALIHFDKVTDPKVKVEIKKMTTGYADKPQYFIDKLASGVAMIAAAFYPKPVIVRMSDFKTNEYANLVGGHFFEPKEENPMIGWRGASRYYDSNYREGFALECAAMRKVRGEMGLKNVILMIPFCRTPDEGRKVIEEMKKNGLERGVDGLQVYVMCEIPSNVILADEYCDIFDGFSIGSNDLTQLTLGLDRDSSLVSHLYDERSEAVKSLIRSVIKTCRRRERKIGICGQAPSDYPEFATFLVEEGIDSISLSSDTVLKTRMLVADVEARLSSGK